MSNLQTQLLENSSEKLARLLTSTGVKVEFSSRVQVPHADLPANTIRIPPLADTMTYGEERILHGTLDHEAAHLLYTKLADGSRPEKPAGLKGFICNALEDGRINRLMGQRYIGSIENISDSVIYIMKKAEELGTDAKNKDNRAYIVHTALCKLAFVHVWKRPDMGATLGHVADELLSTLPTALLKQLEAIVTFEDVSAAVEPVYKWLAENQPEEEKPEPKPGKGEKSKGGKKDKSEAGDPGEGDGEGDSSDGEGDEGEGDSADDEKPGKGKPESSPDAGDNADEGEGEGEGSAPSDEASDDAGDGEEGAEGGTPVDSDSDETVEGRAADAVRSDVDRQLVQLYTEFIEKLDETVQEALPTAVNTTGTGVYVSDTSPDTVVGVDVMWKAACRSHGTDYMQDQARRTFTNYKQKVAPLATRLIMDLQARGKAWSRDLNSGRRLDTGVLSRTRVADNRVFMNRIKKETVNTAVTLLIDGSGSMGG